MTASFDTEKYVKLQKEGIMNAVKRHNKLYFELGGKLFDDHHASRVLPGFAPDTKIKMLSAIKDEAELIICVNSENIQNGRIRSDYNTLYTEDCIRLIRVYRELGFFVSGVVLTQYNEQPKAVEFLKRLKKMGEKVYRFWYIENYPNDLGKAIESFEKNDFIETTKPVVVITSSGSASGKLSTCLSQIYREAKRGEIVGYAKYDIFPVWDLPTNHPVNLAFEAATADSKDRILVDSYYLEKYHKIVSNYNRDLDVFPIIKAVTDMVNCGFNSPTEMVINTMSQAIIDEDTVCQAAKAEVCRRYFTYLKQYCRGHIDEAPIKRVEEIMRSNGITLNDYELIPISRKWFNNHEGIVLQLKGNGFFFVERNEDIIQSLEEKMKSELSILKGSYAHASFILSLEEEKKLKDLGIFLTCEKS